MDMKVLTYAIECNAKMIYWVHSVDLFRHMIPGDENLFGQELKCLRKYLRNGRVLSVTIGTVFTFNGTNFYPMKVQFNGLLCHVYPLVT